MRTVHYTDLSPMALFIGFEDSVGVRSVLLYSGETEYNAETGDDGKHTIRALRMKPYNKTELPNTVFGDWTARTPADLLKKIIERTDLDGDDMVTAWEAKKAYAFNSLETLIGWGVNLPHCLPTTEIIFNEVAVKLADGVTATAITPEMCTIIYKDTCGISYEMNLTDDELAEIQRNISTIGGKRKHTWTFGLVGRSNAQREAVVQRLQELGYTPHSENHNLYDATVINVNYTDFGQYQILREQRPKIQDNSINTKVRFSFFWGDRFTAITNNEMRSKELWLRIRDVFNATEWFTFGNEDYVKIGCKKIHFNDISLLANKMQALKVK